MKFVCVTSALYSGLLGRVVGEGKEGEGSYPKRQSLFFTSQGKNEPVRLTNDCVCATVESAESLSPLVSLIFWWTLVLKDLASFTCYTGIHSSPDPFVILEASNKHTHYRCACTHRNTCSYSLMLCSLHQFWHFHQTSAQSEAAWWKPPEHTSSIIPRKPNTTLSVTLSLLC